MLCKMEIFVILGLMFKGRKLGVYNVVCKLINLHIIYILSKYSITKKITEYDVITC